MPLAAPQFYDEVVGTITLVLYIACLLVEVLAFVHCLLQRADGFAAIGTMSKTIWLALTGGGLLLTLVFPVLFSPIALLGLVIVAVALVYLLDIRPALRDAVDGQGSW